MSSVFGSQPPRFSPPQSAQPYRSIFGGPSSQDVTDLEPYPETQQGGNRPDQHDSDVDMEDVPLTEIDHSDDETYFESEDDGSVSDDEASNDGDSYKLAKKQAAVLPSSSKQHPDSPPSSPSYRPNRFRGPESTWRKLTFEDRQNAQALEELRARDLAAHLYNAFALRVRAREIARQALESDKQLDETEAFVPPKRWTAWPVPATEVPRPGEHLRRQIDDEWTLRMPPDPRPSAELEESIIAIMLKTAKDRFQARDWTTKGVGPNQKQRARSMSQTNDETTGIESEWECDIDTTDAMELRPVVQADDDKSRRQLRPLTRNILTRFDQLLMGLHHARKGGMTGDDSSASEWQSDTESAASNASHSRKRRKGEKGERSQSRGRKRSRRSSVRATSTTGRSRSVLASSARTPSHSRGRSFDRDRRRSASRIRRGLRDWSEVLGVASIIGLPHAAVMRTARRCAALFGEDMEFRTFSEGQLQHSKEGDVNKWEYVENETDESEPEQIVPSPPSRTQSRKSRSRAASTIGSTSRPSSPTSEAAGSTQRLKGKGQHRKQDIVCPVKSCPRHIDGFTRTWNLNLHMKRMHAGYRSRSASLKSAGARSRAPSVSG
ncbi:hypothetical protein KXW98_004645 [Aspergillus fumigatus]|jgi:hypothetical protein|uniref:Rrn9 domain-containing protein n=1 Tax=Aspergillus fumigatus (strain CBS 144.89 / FGSC A1163 / CEA10) TaxID=451804 RepID=B0Y611_ASPFC|nr:hypothetical protein AFUB_065280 [Aspergillus fumigatus A1163]KAH1279663.1 hypothetical protein KXX45_006003 [Aspergillus fumigatus]KAH1284036.1 hypothetical protein KXX48_001981 [Aspergillus fumigatus]KAH1288586.1 hypothetical protein KXX30_007551 [Aspergillus fumigatus]KAH1332411.1 hypothetical protein KXX38_000041 [Aspergillus fumigatus]